MQNYKIVVSRDNKKYSLVLKAENESAARDRVHKEGYSILTLEEIGDNENVGSTFIFEGYQKGELKHGKIAGNDIFKAYVKLTKDLGYTLDYIYPEGEKEMSIEKRQEIIEELREEYDLYFNKGKKPTNIKKKNKKINEEEDDDFDLTGFYLNKELEDTNKLIEKVLQKINDIFAGKSLALISSERKEKLKTIYNEIIKLQKSSNISKLREIGELALTKIGELELEELEKSKNNQDRELLKDTNKLLKELGSKNQFIEKERDFFFQAKSIWNNLREIFKAEKKPKKTRQAIETDTNSYSYVKSMLYLSKYKLRLSENTKFILKNFFKLIVDKELREETFLARSVIKQNIVLLEARQKGVSISYTFLKKGLSKLAESILGFFKILEQPLFAAIVIYTLVFAIYFEFNLLGEMPDYNFEGLFLFVALILIFIAIHLAKNLWMLVLNFVILTFIIIFGVINF